MKKRLSCELKVRSYELDAYGHVNHAVFLHYYEQARVEYLEQRDLSFESLWREGFVFVIVRAEIDYIKPLRNGELLEIPGEITDVGSTSITVNQEIYRMPDRELISRGKFVAVFVDIESGQSVTIAESFRKAFL